MLTTGTYVIPRFECNIHVKSQFREKNSGTLLRNVRFLYYPGLLKTPYAIFALLSVKRSFTGGLKQKKISNSLL